MKPALKQILNETYIDVICLIVGLTTLLVLFDQINKLGYGIFNIDPQKPFQYARVERNITNLILFAVISVSGITYGLIGICKCLSLLKKNQEESDLK